MLSTDAHKPQKGEGGLSGGRKTPRRGVGENPEPAFLCSVTRHLAPASGSAFATLLLEPPGHG